MSNCVTGDSSLLITGSADQTAKLWTVKTGTQLYTFNFDSPTRSVDFAVGDKLAVITTDPFMGLPSAIHVKRIARDPNDRKFLYSSALTNEIQPDFYGTNLKLDLNFGIHKNIYSLHQ